MREDGRYIEAGENDNLIVQKLEANPNALGIFGYSFLEQNARQGARRARSTASRRLRHDRGGQVSRSRARCTST